ncbi:hypothetical protein FIV42_00500 [Persicimonas caeni]|uniref:Carboxypeptidase regulatory-like domain-containing protein n=1 Tax=Persicimonas caeni TaxID=2292766 RepID=A0A4Y6PLS2_PERCE|nr:hypothetical protein [Persicimonas caeni]QDG49266.1 hypothetical protein FIV42_00500 [Persicimonas caeni]QED30487.1 hypothetical protein FRD00_00495 [Persicimonas caeni]
MNSTKRGLFTAIALAFLTLGGAAIYTACIPDGDSKAQLRAKRVTTRDELIGGPVALGEIGDYILENDQIRVVIEDVGYASGSGLFGGSLIDADLIHQNAKGDIFGGNGKDTFGEFFPAYFLEMLDPEEIEVINDGSDGKAAIVEVRGRGGEFVTMLRFINQAMINSYDAELGKVIQGVPADSDGEPLVTFSVRYILEPGARHVRVESTLENVSDSELTFPDRGIVSTIQSFMGIDLSGFSVPLGGVLGFGKLNSLFVPEIGYDLRWGLEDTYRTPIELPAFPGKITDFIGSSNTNGTNYGFIAGASEERNFVNNKSDIYGDTGPVDMLLLFYASGFGGVLTHDMPATLAPNETFTFTNYLIVGEGDVASLVDEALAIREIDTQRVAGRVVDDLSGEPVGENVSVLIYRAREDVSDPATNGCTVDGEGFEAKKPLVYSQAFTNKEGMFDFRLPTGHYCYRTRDRGRPLSDYVHFEVANKEVILKPEAKAYATIQARIVDQNGTPVPAKIMLVGTHEHREGMLKRHFLFDLEAGEPWRTTDMIPDTEDPATRKYLEAIDYASADGMVTMHARPNTYDVYFSRGTEYELVKREGVQLEPGKIKRLQISLERQMNPKGYLSGDFHMHARGSIDSGLDFNSRVVSIAAEGVEVVASTDHNHVSDYRPYIYRNELHPWLNSVVGVELTTFEFGHFNAFPLDYEVGSVNGGAVPWQRLPPQKIFDELRSHGAVSEEDTIIQINHPRDSILGYFGQYNVDPFTTEVTLPFQEASGQDKLIATLSTSSGNAYMRDCRKEDVDCRGDKDFESTFSWDFDAIEIFNGKHLEQLRHYRIPYGAGEWPEEVSSKIIETVCTDEFADELETYCDDNGIDTDACEHPLDGHSIDDWCSFDLDELHARYGKGDVMCDGDEVAFAGALDDWYNLLNYPRSFVRGDDMNPGEPVYKRYTATGNSDSHTDGKPEFRQPGSPRNYFYVGHDDPAQMQPAELARALKERRNIVTNGPFAAMKIADAGVGEEIKVDAGTVSIEVTVRAVDWVGADRFRIVANGEPTEIDDDETPTEYEFELDENGEFTTTVSVDIEKDTWFVLEVEGDNSMFPVYTPQEIPQVNFEAAIGSLAGSFGFGGSVEGLSPTEVFPLTPFAFTNPIWVVYDQGADTDGEFTPPAPPHRSCSQNQFQPGALLSADDFNKKKLRLDAVQMPFEVKPHKHTPFERAPGAQRDVRILFENWHTH